jgi:hypothetical protein
MQPVFYGILNRVDPLIHFTGPFPTDTQSGMLSFSLVLGSN